MPAQREGQLLVQRVGGGHHPGQPPVDELVVLEAQLAQERLAGGRVGEDLGHVGGQRGEGRRGNGVGPLVGAFQAG